jgi:hypothetical protein
VTQSQPKKFSCLGPTPGPNRPHVRRNAPVIKHRSKGCIYAAAAATPAAGSPAARERWRLLLSYKPEYMLHVGKYYSLPCILEIGFFERKAPMPEAGKSCLRRTSIDSLSRKTTVHGPRRTSLCSEELRLGTRFMPENYKSSLWRASPRQASRAGGRWVGKR